MHKHCEISLLCVIIEILEDCWREGSLEMNKGRELSHGKVHGGLDTILSNHSQDKLKQSKEEKMALIKRSIKIGQYVYPRGFNSNVPMSPHMVPSNTRSFHQDSIPVSRPDWERI